MKSLFKIRILQLKNILKRTTLPKFFLFLLLGAGILVVMTFVFLKVFGYLYHQEEFPMFFKLFLCEKILAMTFLTMFMMLILSSLISTLNIFFVSRDLHLLLSSPLRARTIFIWKTVEVGVSSSLMAIFFSLPVLQAYSYYFAPRIGDIIGIITIFIAYILCGVFIGIIIGLIVPAFFSVNRMQPVLSIVSILLISAIVIFLRLLRPEQFGNPDTIRDVVQYMSRLDIRGAEWFPFTWAADGLHKLATHEYYGFFKDIIAFAVIDLAMVFSILFLQKRYYLQLFDKLNKSTAGNYKSSWKLPKFLSEDYSSLWKKEVKTFFRTPSQWSQLLIIGAIMIVFILNIKGIPLPHPSVKTLIAFLNLGMAAFIMAGLNSRFTFTTIPMEYPGIVNVMASPFPRRKILRFKLFFYAIPQLILGFTLFFAGDAALEFDPFFRFTGCIFLIPVLPFLTILALFFSLKVDESVPLTPQNLVASRSGILYMLWSLFYISAGMIFFIRPLFIYYFTRMAGEPTPVTEIFLWYGGFVLVNAIVIIFLYKKCVSMFEKK